MYSQLLNTIEKKLDKISQIMLHIFEPNGSKMSRFWTSLICFFAIANHLGNGASVAITKNSTASPLPPPPPPALIQNTTKLRFQDPFCPSPDTITPCVCTSGKRSSLHCQGHKVTQQGIEGVMDTLRKFNGVRPHQWLNLEKVTIQKSLMTLLDLTPFNLTRMDSLMVNSNRYLIEIIGPESNVTTIRDKKGRPRRQKVRKNSRGKIQVKLADFSGNALTDEGLKDTLKYFSPSKLERLILSGNGIQGSLVRSNNREDESEENGDDAVGEFLPDLSKLKNLRHLNLSWNAIDRVAGGQFRMNKKLVRLALENNRIDQVGPGAFAFEDFSQEESQSEEKDHKEYGDALSIFLNFNQLSNSKMSPENGLEALDRPVQLYLEGNQFEFISANKFQTLLNKDDTSFVDLKRNPVVCDKKNRWLTKQRKSVRRRVRNAHCVDHPRETVFTATLV